MQICKERGARRVPYGGMIMKNIGKKLSALLLGVLLCATAALSAAAATGTVTLEDCDGLQITLRDNMTAITCSSQPDDSYFTSNGLDYNEVMRAFEEGNIYLQATDNTKAMTLTLSYSESAASKRLGNYKDYDLAQLTEMKNNAIALSGGTYNSGTPDEVGDNMVWIFYNITAEGVHQYRAETVADGKNIALTLYRNGGDVQPDDYNILTDIVSTVNLTKRAAAAEELVGRIKAALDKHATTEVDGKKIYAAGDTSKYPQMAGLRLFHLDWALFPTDGKYNMGPEEATFCADMIQPRWAVPIHMKPGQLFDREMAERFDYDNRLILEPGEEIGLAEW